MKGNNILEFNHFTMMEAIEHYLNSVLLKQRVKVIKVKENTNVHTFEIEIEPEKSTDDGSN